MRRKKFFMILTILWMVFIFCMSGANQEESNYQSSSVSDLLCRLFVEDYEEMGPEQQLALQDRLTFPVRKGAHMTEYAVLGILLTLATGRRPAALAIGSLYAVTDEIHQSFVPGRSCEARDVLIDTAGVLIGIFIVTAFRRLNTNDEEKQEANEYTQI